MCKRHSYDNVDIQKMLFDCSSSKHFKDLFLNVSMLMEKEMFVCKIMDKVKHFQFQTDIGFFNILLLMFVLIF